MRTDGERLGWGAAAHRRAAYAVLGACSLIAAATLVIGAGPAAVPGGVGVRGVRGRQELLSEGIETSDEVTLGPYAGYAGQTWHFHDSDPLRPAVEDDNMYQPDTQTYLPVAEPLAQGGVQYQMSGGPVNYNQGSLVPWTWDDVIYQR